MAAIAAAVPRLVLQLIFFILILPIPEVLRRQLTQKRNRSAIRSLELEFELDALGRDAAREKADFPRQCQG